MKIQDVITVYVSKYPQADAPDIERAFLFARKAHWGQKRVGGAPYIQHPLQSAYTVAKLGLDKTTIIAALLHDVIEENQQITHQTLHDEFGPKIAELVNGVTKLAKVEFTGKQRQIESLRKMFLVMAKDIRVVLIKLADRLHNMQTIHYLPKKRQERIARETLDIYAPLADRLGIFEIRWQLEDLAFKVLKPEEYKWIQSEVRDRRNTLEGYAKKVSELLKIEITKEGIKSIAKYRVKHFYSIYKKAVFKYDRDVSRVYDLIAVRVQVESIEDCYAVLGIIHRLWTPLAHRIKDYIAIPKPNNYQALHTTVFAIGGKLTEIQIQTKQMYREATYGIAAHWNYNEQWKQSSVANKDQLKWINQISSWHEKLRDNDEFFDTLKIDLFKDKLFVFTPLGDVIDLPRDSTALDFAYRIHTELGHSCTAAKVNDKIISLSQPLQSGDVIEIMKDSKRKGPSRDWLNIVKTHQAKSAIRNWFRSIERSESITIGKKILAELLIVHKQKKIKTIPQKTVDSVLKKFNFKTLNNLYIALAHDDLSPHLVMHALFPSVKHIKRTKVRVQDIITKYQVILQDNKNIKTQLSHCCHPNFKDVIVGFCTKQNTITIHRIDCKFLKSKDKKRIFQSYWYQKTHDGYRVLLSIHAQNKIGIIKDILEEITRIDLNISHVETKDYPFQKNGTYLIIGFHMKRLDQIRNITDHIERINGVCSTRKIIHAK